VITSPAAHKLMVASHRHHATTAVLVLARKPTPCSSPEFRLTARMAGCRYGNVTTLGLSTGIAELAKSGAAATSD
jgi:hypothetical protein